MFTRHLVALVLISSTVPACPETPTFVTTDDNAGETSTGHTPTTTAASSTGDSDASSSSTTTTTTGAEAVDCGVPSDACEPTSREWCAGIAGLCSKTPLNPAPGSGSTNYCELVAIQCADRVPPCQVCNYIANTCKQLGGGERACNDALADCLCRATEHGLPIN